MPTKKHSLSLFLIIIALLPMWCLQAQTSTHSPYSRYGIGELQYNGFSQNLGKGGIAYSINTPNSINFLNPASYSSFALTNTSLPATTFEIGVNSRTSFYQSTLDTAWINRTSLAYIALGFQIPKKKWGLSVGLLPYSSIGYKLVYKTIASTGDSITYQYDGSGGMNTLYLGNAFRIGNNLSLGLNVCYLFGIMTNSSAVIFTTGDNNISTLADKKVNVSDVLLNGGIQYRIPIKTEYSLTFGATYSNTTNVHAVKDIVTTRFTSTGAIVDTIIQDSSANGNFKIPQRIGFGVSFAKDNHWLIGADVSWQQWSTFSSPFDQYDVLSDALSIGIGAECTPNKKEWSSYFNKVRYRVGFNYSNSFVLLDGDKINQYGLTIGLGFPIKFKSLINVGIELGSTQSINANALNEMYGKVCIGFTLNDNTWFSPRKEN